MTSTSTKPKTPAAEWASLDELHGWAQNPRLNTKAVAAVKASIERFGFGTPLVANKRTGEVIAGHTRLKAAAELGLQHVPVRWMDLSEDEGHLLALADNKLNELAEWDESLLGEILNDLQHNDVDVSTAGFDDEFVMKLLAQPEVELDAGMDSAVPDGGNAPAPTLNPEIPSGAPTAVRMVQLFFSPDDHAKFIRLARQLGTASNTTKLNEIVMEALARACSATQS